MVVRQGRVLMGETTSNPTCEFTASGVNRRPISKYQLQVVCGSVDLEDAEKALLDPSLAILVTDHARSSTSLPRANRMLRYRRFVRNTLVLDLTLNGAEDWAGTSSLEQGEGV